MNDTLNKPKICIVDDDVTNQTLMQMMLEDEYDVCIASSGEEALALAITDRPDLMLLDIMLPEVSGYEVCEQLGEQPETADIPVIFVTGLEDNHSEELGLEVGAADYLTKPVSAPVMKARIARVLETGLYIEYLERSLIQSQEQQQVSNI